MSARPSPRTVEPTPGRPAARPQLTPPLRYTHDTSQYGEFPLPGLLKLLEPPAVDEALHAAEHKEGSVDEADKISRAHAFFEDCDPTVDETCDLEHPPHAFQPSLVDVGSGAGRLVLAAATMRPWRSVCGIEASKPLAGLAAAAIEKLEASGVVEKGVLSSVHADANLTGGRLTDVIAQDRTTKEAHVVDPAGEGEQGGDIAAAASALAGADLAIAYSTAFPSPDGLRLPHLSAALSAVMRPGTIAVTCDKWLVGRRFEFVDMVKLQGEDGPEDVIRAFIWRLTGEAPVAAAGDSTPGVEVVAKELESILYDYMDEDDACSQNPDAAMALLEDLEDELSVMDTMDEDGLLDGACVNSGELSAP